jgi:Dolichyl-phosphate-mannose-protein mannosyltransferase
LSSSQTDVGDYAALVTRLKKMTGWDDSTRWLAGALPDIGPFDRRVIAVGGIVFAVLMALSDRYGFDRDELYFLDCARHLQASYVDQPVLAPFLAWVSLKLFGVSLPGLRVWPALAAWATVVVAGLTAREFGGTRRAQLLAAAGPIPILLGADYLANTTGYELLAWAGLALVVVRIGRTGDCRWWLAGGAVAGLGVADDHSMSFFAIAVVIGALLSGGLTMIWNRWFLAGAVIAVAFEVPDLWWQAQHGWATIAMTEALNRENGGLAHVGTWIVGQLGITALTLAGVSVIGLWCLSRSGRPLWRALAWAYWLLFVLFAVTSGAKTYYLAAAYVYLAAAGSVAIDGWLQARPARLRNLLLVTAAAFMVTVPIALPVLPAADIGWTYKIDTNLGETVGWPQFVRTVDGVWRSLPPSQRASAVIYTADYGEAGAINELGRGMGLPTAVSGHNSEWWWGPGNPHATTVVAVEPGPIDIPGNAAYTALKRAFTSVRVAATLSNPDGIHNQEWGGHVYICTGLRLPWDQIWPYTRHYD